MTFQQSLEYQLHSFVSSSLANFCGLVDDDPETADKWQMRMSDLSHDKLIGKGADGEPRPEQLGLREDEADGAARRRCSPRMPISLYKPSRRCQRQVLRKGKQGGIIQTAWAGCSDLMVRSFFRKVTKLHILVFHGYWFHVSECCAD